MGKHVVTDKLRGSKDVHFPLSLALAGLHPLDKVWVDYRRPPENVFDIKINDENYLNLVKEEIDFDPTIA